MTTWKKGLTINGRNLNYKELLKFSSDNIVSADTNPWEKEIYRFIITWLSDVDHIVQFSSGTTGKPKEIRLLKTSMISSAINTCQYFRLNKGDTALLCMPVDYIAGKMMIVRSIMAELNLLIIEPRSVPDIHLVQAVDFCAMVPMQVINLLMCNKDLHPLKKLIVGGAEISSELEKLLEPVSTEVYATYGMAETSSHVAVRRLNGPHTEKSYEALPEVKLSQDERGCLVIDASYLPEKVVSNDLVEFTGPGTFRWLGRYDNLINSGGVKIVPEEVEAIIMSKTMIECIAIGYPDKQLGEKLVVVFEKGHMHHSIPVLKKNLENILPRRWKPKELVTVSEFPRNNALKIDRRKLLEMVLA